MSKKRKAVLEMSSGAYARQWIAPPRSKGKWSICAKDGRVLTGDFPTEEAAWGAAAKSLSKRKP